MTEIKANIPVVVRFDGELCSNKCFFHYYVDDPEDMVPDEYCFDGIGMTQGRRPSACIKKYGMGEEGKNG